MNKRFLTLAVPVLIALGCSPKPEQVAAPTAEQLKPIGAPEIYADYLNRDIRDDMFYFVLPDRFHNGNPDNDNGSKTIAISQGGYDPTSKWHFHGGDMQGLEKKLDYLKGMGITAIWMTPILRNRAMQGSSSASHGYWILDFTQIDPHFGSNDDLKSLISAAHKKGIKIFFDIITNHTADVIKYEECHNPDGSMQSGKNECKFKSAEQLASGDSYTPFVPTGEENLKTPAWLNDPKYYNNQGDSFWQGESAIKGDFVGLDDIDTTMPEVVDGFIDIYRNIISEFKPDGFRIDTVKHVDLSFWQQFSPAIVGHAKSLGIPNFHVFGEVYSGDPEVLSRYTTSGKMPSVLDFGFQHAAAEIFYRGNHPDVLQTLLANDDYYADHDSQADILMNFLGNHDMGRTGFFINQGLPDIPSQEKLQRSILSHALMYLSRGIPVVYYGDEQGFTGDGGDVAARENMFASKVDEYNDNDLLGTNQTTAVENFDQAHPIYLAIKELAKLRMQHGALRYGQTHLRYLEPESKVFAFSRIDLNDPVDYLIAFNTDNKTQKIQLPKTATGYQQVYGQQSVKEGPDTLELTLPALSVTVLKSTTAIPQNGISDIKVRKVTMTDERIKIAYDVVLDNPGSLSLMSVKTELQTPEDQLALLSEDHAPPYAVVVDKEKFASLQGTGLKVTVTPYNGRPKVYNLPIPATFQ